MTLEQIRRIGVGPEAQLKLEYFFYTDASGKAEPLGAALRKLGYSVETGPAAGQPRLQVITGWTRPMAMTDSTVAEWSGRMCDLGFEYDCEFDGWGTTPER